MHRRTSGARLNSFLQFKPITMPGHHIEILKNTHAPAWLARTMRGDYARLQLHGLNGQLKANFGRNVNFGRSGGPYDGQRLSEEKRAYEKAVTEALALREERKQANVPPTDPLGPTARLYNNVVKQGLPQQSPSADQREVQCQEESTDLPEVTTKATQAHMGPHANQSPPHGATNPHHTPHVQVMVRGTSLTTPPAESQVSIEGQSERLTNPPQVGVTNKIPQLNCPQPTTQPTTQPTIQPLIVREAPSTTHMNDHSDRTFVKQIHTSAQIHKVADGVRLEPPPSFVSPNRFEPLACDADADESDDADESGELKRQYRRRRKDRPAAVRAKVKCKQCQFSDCEESKRDRPLIAPVADHRDAADDQTPLIAPMTKGDKENNTSQAPRPRAGPHIKMPALSLHWPQLAKRFPLNQQREQPILKIQDRTQGDKYTLIVIIRDTIQKLTVDSGSFLSVISKKLATELGLHLNKVERICAKAATGFIHIDHVASVDIDFGVIRASVTFAVVDHQNYSNDLILLGSNALRSLGVIANFEDEVILIKGIYPCKLYTNSRSSEEHITEMKQEFISLSAIPVKLESDTKIFAMSEAFVDIKMKRLECVQLSGTFSLFTTDSDSGVCGVKSPDMVIDDSFPWQTEKLRVRLINTSTSDVTLRKGVKIGLLKPLLSDALAKKLGNRYLQEAHVMQPLTDEGQEAMLINSILGELPGEDGDLNTIGDKRPREASQTASHGKDSPDPKRGKGLSRTASTSSQAPLDASLDAPLDAPSEPQSPASSHLVPPRRLRPPSPLNSHSIISRSQLQSRQADTSYLPF